RNRFDCADLAHLLKGAACRPGWARLLCLLWPHWLILYRRRRLCCYIYPPRRGSIPDWVMDDFDKRLHKLRETPPLKEDICRGTLLSRAQYLQDIEENGFIDARHWPEGTMTSEEIAEWTAAIKKDGPK